jgi:hypothetical protein
VTKKDKELQDLRQRVRGLEEELTLAVECCRICRLCAHMGEDCSPTGAECRPEWRG